MFKNFAIALAMAGCVPVAVHGQRDPDDDFGIQRTVARYTRSSLSRDSLGFQIFAQEFLTAHPPTGPRIHPFRTAEQAAILASELRAGIIDSLGPSLCRSAIQEGCISKVIRIGVPRLMGDSARIWVYSYDARYNEDVDEEYLVARDGTQWKVMRLLQIREGIRERTIPLSF